MKLQNILSWLRLSPAQAELEITKITDDSRKVETGTLFVARTGSAVDGAKFIQNAKAAGAAITLGDLTSGADIEVENLAQHLPTLLENFYQHPSQNLILNAVTGTNGKTTTAFILHQVLQDWSAQSALTGTVCQILGAEVRDSQLTTPGLFEFYPLMAEVQSKGLKYLNFEASSHALDQGRLGHLKVRTAIFTNLTQDHLDYHGDMESYYQAKLKLFNEHTDTNSRAVINLDNPFGQRLAQDCSAAQWTTSLVGQADFNLTDLSENSLRPKYRIYGQDLDLTIETLLPGDFNRENLLGAVVALYDLGVPASVIQQSIAKLSVPGRMQKIPHSIHHVFVDYAHTPDALERVLASIKGICTGRIVTVFGCGGDRDRTKRPLMAAATEKYSDLCILTSDNPRTEDPAQIFADVMRGFKNQDSVLQIADRKNAIHQAVALLQPEDVLLIAGKGHEDYQIIGTQKFPFDDRLVAAAALESKS